MDFSNQLNNTDILENFDFEQYLQNADSAAFDFDAAAFDGPDGIEASLGGGS